MTSTLIPVALKGIQNILNIGSANTQIYNDSIIFGRHMIAMIHGTELLTTIDFGVFTNRAVMIMHYEYNLLGAKRSDFPVNIPASQTSSYAGNYFTFNYDGSNIYISSTVAISNVIFRCFIIPAFYCGLTLTGMDRIVENTAGNGIDVDNIFRFNAGITITGGDINIGSVNETFPINIGTNGTRSITLGNTNSTLNLNGTIENTSTTGTVNFTDSDNIQWTSTNAVAKRVGSIIYISFGATLNSINLGITANTTYNLCTVIPVIKFNNAFQSYGQLFINGQSPGIVFTAIDPSNCILQIQTLLNIPSGQSLIVSGSITYII